MQHPSGSGICGNVDVIPGEEGFPPAAMFTMKDIE
jgi:hypothetical protein